MSQNKILLVEGESDKSFFVELLKEISGDVDVKIAIPHEIDRGRNGKEGVLRVLLTLLNNLEDGAISKLACIVDSDFQEVSGACGFSASKARFSKALKEKQFYPGNNCDCLYQHSEGLPDLLVWFLPNNRDDGTLETLLKNAIHHNEKQLFQHVEKSIAGIPQQKFSPHNLTKAEVITWLAWQEKPGHGLYYCLDNKERKHELLDKTESSLRALMQALANFYTK